VNRQSNYSARLTEWMVLTVLLVLFLAGLSGCSGTYGRLTINPDVKALFERNEVLPDYRYFYTESSTWPRVIMGLHQDYTLQSEYWHPVAATPERLHRWLNFQGQRQPYLVGNNGSDILDNNGRRIGVWYALKNRHDWGVVKMIDDKTVNVILQKAPESQLLLRFRQP
jgi:hypothetical protein